MIILTTKLNKIDRNAAGGYDISIGNTIVRTLSQPEVTVRNETFTLSKTQEEITTHNLKKYEKERRGVYSGATETSTEINEYLTSFRYEWTVIEFDEVTLEPLFAEEVEAYDNEVDLLKGDSNE